MLNERTLIYTGEAHGAQLLISKFVCLMHHTFLSSYCRLIKLRVFVLIDWQNSKPNTSYIYHKVTYGLSRIELKELLLFCISFFSTVWLRRRTKSRNPSRSLKWGNQTSASKINCYVPVSTHYKSTDVERDMGSVSAIETVYCWTVVKVLFLLHHISTSINLKNTQLVAHLFDFKISTKENK